MNFKMNNRIGLGKPKSVHLCHVGHIENTSYHLIHAMNLFLLLYLNLQDDNGMFRNSLNCISASLTETALLLALLHCEDTYGVTCIVVVIS